MLISGNRGYISNRSVPFRTYSHVVYGERIQSCHAMSRCRITCPVRLISEHLVKVPQECELTRPQAQLRAINITISNGIRQLNRQNPCLQGLDVQIIKSRKCGWRRPADCRTDLTNRNPAGPRPGGGHSSGGVGPHTYRAL